MRTKSELAIPATLLCALLFANLSVAAPIACPAAIAESPNVSTNAESWTVVSKPGERPLEYIGIYLGTLSEYGAQTPDSVTKAKLLETVTWKIRRSQVDTFWIGCSYLGTTAMLFQQLDSKIKRCTATYDLLPSGRRQKNRSMQCYEF